MSVANTYEPKPIANLTTPLWEDVWKFYSKTNKHFPHWQIVVQDFKERDSFGKSKYGTSLQAYNGRNALTDLKQEILDSIVYSYQCFVECEDQIKQKYYRDIHLLMITTYENLILIEKQ
jgi:hypothetical protein